MKPLTFKNFFNFGEGIINQNKDFKILSSHEDGEDYDLLIFTDSKGTSIGDEVGKEWTTLLIKKLKSKGISYLFVSRPKEMTVFFTLLNFLELNNIKFKKLVTNVGFVDTTPKKEEFIDDIFSQCPFDNKKLKKYSLCEIISELWGKGYSLYRGLQRVNN